MRIKPEDLTKEEREQVGEDNIESVSDGKGMLLKVPRDIFPQMKTTPYYATFILLALMLGGFLFIPASIGVVSASTAVLVAIAWTYACFKYEQRLLGATHAYMISQLINKGLTETVLELQGKLDLLNAPAPPQVN